jgi:hypothetical protein
MNGTNPDWGWVGLIGVMAGRDIIDGCFDLHRLHRHVRQIATNAFFMTKNSCDQLWEQNPNERHSRKRYYSSSWWRLRPPPGRDPHTHTHTHTHGTSNDEATPPSRTNHDNNNNNNNHHNHSNNTPNKQHPQQGTVLSLFVCVCVCFPLVDTHAYVLLLLLRPCPT